MNKKLLILLAFIVLCGVLCVGTVNAVKDVNKDLDTTVYADEYHETGKIKASDYGADYIYDDRSNYNEPPINVKVKTEKVKDYKVKKIKLNKKTTVKVTCPTIKTSKQLKKILKSEIKDGYGEWKNGRLCTAIKDAHGNKYTIKVKQIGKGYHNCAQYKTVKKISKKTVIWNKISDYWPKAIKLIKKGYKYTKNTYKNGKTYTHFKKVSYKDVKTSKKVFGYSYKITIKSKSNKIMGQNYIHKVKVAYLYN